MKNDRGLHFVQASWRRGDPVSCVQRFVYTLCITRRVLARSRPKFGLRTVPGRDSKFESNRISDILSTLSRLAAAIRTHAKHSQSKTMFQLETSEIRQHECDFLGLRLFAFDYSRSTVRRLAFAVNLNETSSSWVDFPAIFKLSKLNRFSVLILRVFLYKVSLWSSSFNDVRESSRRTFASFGFRRIANFANLHASRF